MPSKSHKTSHRPNFGLSARRTRTDRAGSTAAPLHHTRLPHRRRGADRRSYGARMPPRILVRQRSPGRRHQRERRTYRTDLRPTHRPDRLHPGRLSLSPRGCRSHRTDDRTLRRRAPRHPRYRRSARTHHRRRFIREVNIGEGATIDGASLLENGTVCAGAYVGIDVQARDFIAAEGAASTAARFSNAASPANAARWTNTSRPSIRSFSPTATAKTERPFRSSRVPTPFRTTNPRC